PWTAVWIAERLRDQKEERSIGILSSWTHKKRGLEVNADLIKELNTLPIHETVLALEELRKPKQFICGTQGNQMNVTCRLTNLASHQSTTIEALLDSGCAGSCIDNKFVEEQGLQRIPRPIPVYNADGTLNRDGNGSIKEFVELLVEINNHAERLQLAVTNLG
ncbi:hypothetical protein SERLA73DRAFT_35160, partial [Serpula lacrymans var. lacrymans S7.3]